jgi:hypothetical protein
MAPTSPGELSPDQVEDLVRRGCRWVVTYCWGTEPEPEPTTGRGAPLPLGVLNHIPTPAALAKMRGGQGPRTYFHAELGEDAAGSVLYLAEG